MLTAIPQFFWYALGVAAIFWGISEIIAAIPDRKGEDG